ncbi:polygalacturonase-like [Asparagus officinalis]|nr:polygalacturonase-like [Asparagus officinalis]
MSLSFVTNSSIRGISSLNPKFFHVNLFSCRNLDLRWLTISAPGDSPNTDGIHVGGSSNIAISDSAISTGDDCISLGSGTANVTVSGVTCGPGHGISVGSLGKDADKGDVVGLTVKNCTLTGTSNGIRIKSWKTKRGSRFWEMMKVEDFLFENVAMKNVANPIFIDQEYCPYAACPESEPSRVKINGVKFRNIRGTSSSDEVIKMVCSRRYPCEGVELRDIYLRYIGDDAQLKERATCKNVKGTSSNVKPVSCF